MPLFENMPWDDWYLLRDWRHCWARGSPRSRYKMPTPRYLESNLETISSWKIWMGGYLALVTFSGFSPWLHERYKNEVNSNSIYILPYVKDTAIWCVRNGNTAATVVFAFDICPCRGPIMQNHPFLKFARDKVTWSEVGVTWRHWRIPRLSRAQDTSAFIAKLRHHAF